MKDGARRILLSHGGGGRLMQDLLREVILPPLAASPAGPMEDAACLGALPGDLLFTTDAYVVDPLFFPGGDIGALAVCGTVNDLAMQGGEARALSLALILEEGFPVADLERILRSMAAALAEAGAGVVTGDTKVVERGRGNGVFIATSGVGVRIPGARISAAAARAGDTVLVSGNLGDHGMAVMSRRRGLEFESALVSDVAPLGGMVRRLLRAVPAVRCLRDPTRGGLAAALCDIAAASSVGVRLRESDLPIRPQVRAACNLFGLDPLSVANEGKAVVVCAAEDEARALAALRADPRGADACAIGRVVAAPRGLVVMETRAGGERIVDLPPGEDLPRIC